MTCGSVRAVGGPCCLIPRTPDRGRASSSSSRCGQASPEQARSPCALRVRRASSPCLDGVPPATDPEPAGIDRCAVRAARPSVPPAVFRSRWRGGRGGAGGVPRPARSGGSSFRAGARPPPRPAPIFHNRPRSTTRPPRAVTRSTERPRFRTRRTGRAGRQTRLVAMVHQPGRTDRCAPLAYLAKLGAAGRAPSARTHHPAKRERRGPGTPGASWS